MTRPASIQFHQSLGTNPLRAPGMHGRVEDMTEAEIRHDQSYGFEAQEAIEQMDLQRQKWPHDLMFHP